MGKTLIGTATTDSNGVASVSYVGEGSGILNIQAETSDGTLCSLLSETYTLWDTKWYDIGVIGQKNENWINSDSTILTVTVDENGTTLASTASNKRYSTPDSYVDFVCEFDIVEHTNDWAMFQLGNSSINIRLNEALTGSHVKIWQENSTLYYQIDNNTPTSTTGTSTAYQLTFRCNANDTIKFKNFIVY